MTHLPLGDADSGEPGGSGAEFRDRVGTLHQWCWTDARLTGSLNSL